MRVRLLPHDESFDTLLGGLATNLREAARLLAQALGTDTQGREGLLEQVRELEHSGNLATHAVLQRVNSALVTPFERGDVLELARALDTVLDRTYGALELMVLQQRDELPAGVSEQVQVLGRVADVLMTAVPALTRRGGADEPWLEVDRLVSRAARLHRRLVADLLADVADFASLAAALRMRTVVDELAAAVDEVRRVATIALRVSSA